MILELTENSLDNVQKELRSRIKGIISSFGMMNLINNQRKKGWTLQDIIEACKTEGYSEEMLDWVRHLWQHGISEQEFRDLVETWRKEGNLEAVAIAEQELTEDKEMLIAKEPQVAKATKAIDNSKILKDGCHQALIEARERVTRYKNYIVVSIVHTVGLKSDGTVVAKGGNERGECNTFGWHNIVAIAAGDNHTVGLKSDGTVVAVGAQGHLHGQSWDAGQTNVSSWQNIVAIAAGEEHTVGLKSDGTVVAVGAQGLSVGLRKPRNVGQLNVSSWKDVIAIAAGDKWTLALRSDGTIATAGDLSADFSSSSNVIKITCDGSYGLKSDGTVISPSYLTLEFKNIISEWKNIVDVVSTAPSRLLGLKSDGTVVSTWDSGTSDWRDIVSIAAHGYIVAGLASDGRVLTNLSDVSTSDWKNIVAIFVDSFGIIGLKSDGTIKYSVDWSDDFSDWRNIGPPSEKLIQQWQQSDTWRAQGLCGHCGNQMGGFFTKKCKSCGRAKF
jgi:hypothetical protein